MMLIGVDPHKSTHTATAVESGTNSEVASIRIEANLGEYRRMLTWAARWSQRRWAIENAEGLGRHLASWLLARGEEVIDVPSTATARVRQLSRGGGRKNDRIDAAAAACVAAAQGDYRAMVAEGATDALAVLDEHRVNLAQARVRAVNQLHAPLRALLAGGTRHRSDGRRIRYRRSQRRDSFRAAPDGSEVSEEPIWPRRLARNRTTRTAVVAAAAAQTTGRSQSYTGFTTPKAPPSRGSNSISTAAPTGTVSAARRPTTPGRLMLAPTTPSTDPKTTLAIHHTSISYQSEPNCTR